MILEIADIWVKEGMQADYEAGMRNALPYLTEIEGYISHEIRHGVEEPTRYLLLIKWESIEAHMVNFRESENYEKYRAHVSDFIDKGSMSHFNLVELD